MISGVLLDIDGTLIDSNDAHAMSWAEAIRDNGIGIGLEAVRERVGMGADQLLPDLGIFPENERYEAIKQLKEEIFHSQHLPQLRPFDGARELVERMLDRGLKLVVASSSSRRDLEALLRQGGLDDLLRNSTSADDAPSSKPQPDIIRAALAKIRARPEEAVLIGDTPYDIYAAKRAGLETIAFTCGGWKEQDLNAALAIYDGPRQLLDSWKSSPLATARAA
jgi:HAD superfamily hydrolase (TIGR01509 family)